MTPAFHRGDIYYASLGGYRNAEIGGIRPVLVIQNDMANSYSPVLTVVPVTSVLKKIHQPTHYIFKLNGGPRSMALAEQTCTIDKSKILKYIGRLTDTQLDGVMNAVRKHLGMVENKKIRTY